MSRRTNVRRLSPKEVSVVADLLVDESDDVEDLAKKICRGINQHRSEEMVWVKVVQSGSGYVLYGPYRSAEEGHSDVESAGPGREPGAHRMVSLVPPWGQGKEDR